mmetsp:Transcript_20033/g.46249  ORF Transcript_20033/g.46249 Transcript_20033/m.46249 type:complete len:121 (+) Transcript_20033:573-935(+)
MRRSGWVAESNPVKPSLHTRSQVVSRGARCLHLDARSLSSILWRIILLRRLSALESFFGGLQHSWGVLKKLVQLAVDPALTHISGTCHAKGSLGRLVIGEVLSTVESERACNYIWLSSSA